MLVKDEIKKIIDDFRKKTIDFCKLKNYNNGKIIIYINESDIVVTYQPEQIKF